MNLTLSTVQSIAFALGLLLALLYVGDVLRQRKSPSSTAAWILLLLLLPYLGVVLYLLISARKLERPRARMHKRWLGTWPEVDELQAHPLDVLLRGLGLPGASRGNRVVIHENSDQAMSELLRVIDHAKHRILIDVYSLHSDSCGLRVLRALHQKAQEGVAVYLLMDDVGSVAIRRGMLRRLHKAGARVARFKPLLSLRWLSRAQLRNHRKIVSSDSRIAWTGGRNIGNEYLGKANAKGTWIDLSLTVEGAAVNALEQIARGDWQQATGEELPAIQPCEPLEGGSALQIVPSGPEWKDDLWYSALLSACFIAKRRIWLATPYFVPDDALLNALVLASRRGVEVKLITPEHSDNRLVDWVRGPYLRDLSYAGASVFKVPTRMMHAKAMLLDDQMAALGSSNVDSRSLLLNYEVMVLCYSPDDVAAVGGFLRALLEQSREGVRALGPLREALLSPLRLIAPLL